MTRHWLDWSEPCLTRAATWLIDRFGAGHECDLRTVTCVVPGSRVGRLLLGSIVEECNARDLRLVPPTLITPGAMVGVLAPLVGAIPSPLELELAWLEALRTADPETVAPLVGARPPVDDARVWAELAARCVKLESDLAGDELAFPDVERRVDILGFAAETARWSVLEHVRELVVRRLKATRLRDPVATRREAITRLAREGPGADDHLVLVGVVELNRQQRRVAAAFGERGYTLVHAPDSEAARFDEFGCVREDVAPGPVDIPEELIETADRPADQAQAAVRAVAMYAGQGGAGGISIGLGDPTLARDVRRAAAWAGFTVHDAAGTSLGSTGPWRLLESLLEWVRGPRFQTLALLLRHPDLESWLYGRVRLIDDEETRSRLGRDWPSAIDRYARDHRPGVITGVLPGDDREREAIEWIVAEIDGLLAELCDGTRAISTWMKTIVHVLRSIYGRERAGDDTRVDVEAVLELHEALAQLAGAASGRDVMTDGASALEIALVLAGSRSRPDPPDENAIEMLGWLELHLDLAPSLVVVGVNDGAIPASSPADEFLPDTLRRELGLPNDTRRYARDAYLLEAIVHSRPRVLLVTGRHDTTGEPLTPSRLLLDADPETVLRRTRRLCTRHENGVVRAPVGVPGAATRSAFDVPPLPPGVPQPDHLAVTAFKGYLACPYRFALKHLLKLREADDSTRELSAAQFGNLVHDTVEAFGRDVDVRDSTDPAEIEKFLVDTLHEVGKEHYGSDRGAAVRIQMARVEQRFEQFAHVQARLRREGWRIRDVEIKFEKVDLEIPGDDPMPITGKIDRIDEHEASGRLRLFDYKTSDRGDTPHQTHHESKSPPRSGEIEWVDLQLPLYEHLLRVTNTYDAADREIELAYMLLPKKVVDVGESVATWTPAHLESAVARAVEVVRGIRAGEFEINHEHHPRYDAFVRICRTFAFRDDDPAELDRIDRGKPWE